MRRSLPIPAKVVLALMVALCLGAAALIVLLQHRASEDRTAELRVEQVRAALVQLGSAPYGALAPGDGDPRFVRQENRFARSEVAGGQEFIEESMAKLEAGSPPAEIAQSKPLLEANYAAIDEIYELSSTGGSQAAIDRLGQQSGRLTGQLDRLLKQAGAHYRQGAVRSRNQSVAGSIGVILLLLGAFLFFQLRSGRLQRDKEELLAASRKDALTDPLTGLGNRRALLEDLAQAIPAADADNELILGVYDLDGFKHYNDSFGHPAGDALLNRLGLRLRDLVTEGVRAYRMGGDEFCLVAEIRRGGPEVLARAGELLSESGEAFEVGCSYGTAVIPSEAATASDALRISDQRMYSNKNVRGTATRQSIDVLLKVLEERSEGLVEHVHDVAQLARRTSQALGLSENEVTRIDAAAQLHDIGKCAIPEEILNKSGDLDANEWRFMRQHTLIGARIVLAAPALKHTAELIRSSHEWVDGTGYPDGLKGEEIPLGARVIAVCDAYDAMLTTRPYSPRIPGDEALAELRRCAGSQFDPDVVRAFEGVIKVRPAVRSAEPV